MKTNQLFGGMLVLLISNFGYGQDDPKIKKHYSIISTNEEANNFLFYKIPASLNGSNIDPTPVSSVGSEFGENELSLKLGFPFGVNEDSIMNEDKIKNTYFLKANASASDGISTLWKPGSSGTEYGLSFGYNRIQPYHSWIFTEGANAGKISSEVINWWSIKGNFTWNNYNLITPSNLNPADSILFKRKEANSLILISFNRYFKSKVRILKIFNCLYSVGVGYGKLNNYEELDDRQYLKGTISYNSDSSSYTSIVEKKDAKVGQFKIYEGVACFGEIYFPLTQKPNKYLSLYLGAKLTSYAINKRDNLINGNIGFYFNIKNQQEKAKDVVGFSITGQFNQMKNLTDSDYFKNQFAVLLQATVPLRFN